MPGMLAWHFLYDVLKKDIEELLTSPNSACPRSGPYTLHSRIRTRNRWVQAKFFERDALPAPAFSQEQDV